MLNLRRVDLDVAKSAAAAKKPEGEKGERQQAVREEGGREGRRGRGNKLFVRREEGREGERQQAVGWQQAINLSLNIYIHLVNSYSFPPNIKYTFHFSTFPSFSPSSPPYPSRRQLMSS